MSLWYIGALLSITGSVGSNLGINIQKYSFLQNSKLPADQQRPYTRQPGWAVGLALVILGSVGDFAALALAAQSIITPIGSVTLVANMVFAHYWLKETLSRRDLTGTVLIIAGSVLTVSFGDHSDPTYALSDFRRFFGLTSSLIYTFVILLISSILYAFIVYLRPIKRRIITLTREYDHVLPDTLREERMKADEALTALIARYAPWEKVHPFCYCALSGMLGAQSVLFGKMVSELISTTFQGDNQLLSPFPYVFLVCMLAFVFSQLHFLALALTFFDALYCVPIFQCFFILTSTVGGAAFFAEFAEFDVLQMVMFPMGIATTLLGVFLLAQRDSSSTVEPGEGPGHHVIPASLATFFVDIEREKIKLQQVHRSWSHNWHHGGAISKVQQEKTQMEEMANAAALTAQKGEMRLPADVEASVMREVSAVTGVGGRAGHKRDGSRLMSSVRSVTTAAMGDTGGVTSPFGGLKSFDEEFSPSADRSRRKFKSRSHPTHFVTPSCLLPHAAVEALSGEPHYTESVSVLATATTPASPSAGGAMAYTGVPLLLSPASRRIAPAGRPLLSPSVRRDGRDDPLSMVPLARENSAPVPRHLMTVESSEEVTPVPTPAEAPATIRKPSARRSARAAAQELLPGQLETVVVER